MVEVNLLIISVRALLSWIPHKLWLEKVQTRLKDQYQVSGSAYHEFAKICHEMPRH